MKYTKITIILITGFFFGYLIGRTHKSNLNGLGSEIWTDTIHCKVDIKIHDCKINHGFTLDDVVTEWYNLYTDTHIDDQDNTR